MLRRTYLPRRIGIFPLHLDPPNIDHHRVFMQILQDPKLNLSRLILLPLSHPAVTLQKSLHLSAMAGLCIREFEPILPKEGGGGVSGGTSQPQTESGRGSSLSPQAFAGIEEELQEQKNSFVSVVGVDTMVDTYKEVLDEKTGQIVKEAFKKKVRVDVKFSALEMHEEKVWVVENLLFEQFFSPEEQGKKFTNNKNCNNNNNRQQSMDLLRNGSSIVDKILEAESEQTAPSSASSTHHHQSSPHNSTANTTTSPSSSLSDTTTSRTKNNNNINSNNHPEAVAAAAAAAAKKKFPHKLVQDEDVVLLQWLADMEVGGCLVDRLWSRVATFAPNIPLTALVPTGPAYPALDDAGTKSTIARVSSRWAGAVSVACVRREWSSGYVRRRLFEQEGKCNTLVSGPILRYIDSHNLYRDERRPRQRYSAAVAENAMRLPIISLDDLHHQRHKTTSFTASEYGGSAASGGDPFGGNSGVNNFSGLSSKADLSSKWVSCAGTIPKLELHYDPRNPRAGHIYEQLKTFQVRPGEHPDLIVPIGGDGYLMKCVRKFWSRFIPFFGVNAGHVGFLLNDAALLEEFFCAPLRLYQVSMLYCVAENLPAENEYQRKELLMKNHFKQQKQQQQQQADVNNNKNNNNNSNSSTGPISILGEENNNNNKNNNNNQNNQNNNSLMMEHLQQQQQQSDDLDLSSFSSGHTNEPNIVRSFAFNDAWMERATGQTAKFRICVNGVERSRAVRGDGVLVATASGSTAYAQALGGSPMQIDTPILQLVGSNCTWPVRWRPVNLPEDVTIDLESVDAEKRPCRAYVDSVDLGLVKRLSVRASRVAGVQLAFTRSSDVQAKLYKMQFPDQGP